MAKLTAKQCTKCGAPLALQRGVHDVQCQYCGTVVHVEWGKKPPAEPQPQQTATIYVANPMPAFLPVIIALMVLLPIGGSLIAFLTSGVTTVATNALSAAGVQTPSVLAKSLPATCGLNQEIAIVGQKFEGPGPLITGEIHCVREPRVLGPLTAPPPAEIRERIAAAIEDAVAGRYDPSPRDRDACGYCDFRRSCRIALVAAGDAGAAQLEEDE